MQQQETEILEKRRKIDNYNEDVLKKKPEKTGVREWSTLNNIPFFHVTNSCSNDWMHTVLEGILHYNFKPAMLHFINQNDFTIDQLNQRIVELKYEPDQWGNVPGPITLKRLQDRKVRKFKMTAAEMHNFAHNLPFIIGDLVEEGEGNYILVKLETKILKI